MERKRPQSRGVAMNPVDHPHGGGEGKLQEVEVQFHHGVNLLKGLRQENQREVIN